MKRAILLLLVGCGSFTTSVTTAPNVSRAPTQSAEVVREKPNGVYVGTVEASGSTMQNAVQCESILKREAAKLGASVVYVVPDKVGLDGVLFGQAAHCKGEAYAAK